MPRAVQPDAPQTEREIQLLEQLAALRAELAAKDAVQAPAQVSKKRLNIDQPPKKDTDPHGPLHIPREMHGVPCREKAVVQGKDYWPGHTYNNLSVGLARTIMSSLSTRQHILATKDQDRGSIVDLGEVHDE